jgi:hypothetical protein
MIGVGDRERCFLAGQVMLFCLHRVAQALVGQSKRYFLSLELTYIWRPCCSLLVVFSSDFTPYAFAKVELYYTVVMWQLCH